MIWYCKLEIFWSDWSDKAKVFPLRIRTKNGIPPRHQFLGLGMSSQRRSRLSRLQMSSIFALTRSNVSEPTTFKTNVLPVVVLMHSSICRNIR
ncbi:hypothetical protein Hanom_Chr05g00388851 [Helianthus anomalus]